MKTLEEHLQFADDCFTFAMRFVWDQQRRHPEKSRKELMELTLFHYLLRKVPTEPPDKDPLEFELAELADQVETPLHHLCETPDGDCLYDALDGAWMTTLAKRIIEKHKLKLIVWDATCGSDDDWRMFEHNTPAC